MVIYNSSDISVPEKVFKGSENFAGENSTKSERLSSFDKALSSNGGNSFQYGLSNILNGIRIFGQGMPYVQPAVDVIGLAFVTRPLLSLTNSNLSRGPKLISLLGASRFSMRSYVRALLDPIWAKTGNAPPGFNNEYPWMSVLTNALKSSTGFPDLDVEIATTTPGFRKEVYQYVDGYLEENGQFTLTQNYYGMENNIIPYIFEIWEEYISEVSHGDRDIYPYETALYERYIDYDCRIYHLIMNKNMRNIEQIHMGIQSIPRTFPSGSISDIHNDQRRASGQEEFSMNFSTIGYRFNTWDCIDAFNYTTYFFCPEFATLENRAKYFVKLNSDELVAFNYNAFPYINKTTAELEWYVRKTLYNKYRYK